MVAAKLDQSRVLVTKFHENRSVLKGRSAGQRHTHSCQRRRAVPLRPIWTIMVASKLDQSRVLVTKFRQNRLTLKGRSAGRSAGERHTDRQTWANFKMYLLRQFFRIQWNFFLQYTGDTDAKMMNQNLEIRMLCF